MSRRSQHTDSWVRTRPVLWSVLAITVPGLGYTVSQLVIADRALASAAPVGLVFGLVFAAGTALLKVALDR
ncbi:hypothetical protein [Natrinema pallidum]|uniref:Uncharacterized protein n=2 Tax=Natrinema pallidum TaxID=69527 RepID=L9Z0Q7_9EURY|nr:hypothetical protein [Natrinema pallidum]ELY78763.1 hypothetical protein C487_07367 [Natrinema pallidum DSM 3751]QCW01755.1 hypothetical protein FGF80_00165 [Natrinema pallidum]